MLDASTTNSIYEWEVNSWLYIGVGRYGSYSTYTCTYTFTATINGSCPTGSIGYGDDYQSSCAPYTTVSSGSKMNITSNGNTNFQQVYKIQLPTDVGHIYVQINASDSGFELIGKNFGAPFDSDYNCDDSGYTYYDPNTTMYYMDYYCYTPRVGAFYMFLTNSYAFNGSIQISYMQCPTGMGGFNCTFSSVALNETAPQTFVVPSTSSLTYGFAYVYVDIPANYSGPDYQVYASSTQSGYLYVRYGGYPEDSSYYGYTSSYQYSSFPSSFSLNNFDFVMPGRWYFGLECYSGTNGCNITVQKNNSNVVVTTASTTAFQQTSTYSVTSGSTTKSITSGSTTGSSTYSITSGSTTRPVTSGRATTAGATTAQKTSSAVAVVPTFIAAIFAFLALF
jgi:hypothetical protein